MNAISVTELSNYIKSLFDGDERLNAVCVRGELSNYKVHTTGHHYFSLKDEGAVIDAVIFRTYAGRLKFLPQSGMKVIVFGKVSSFPKNGRYQIYVSDMQPEGVGALYAAFEQLKNKLYKEGLFDRSKKTDLPRFPERIGLVTSPTGAAVRDMIRILRARYPLASVTVCPVKVQGDGAAQDIADMLDYVNSYDLFDVIICGRGGGSIEDLWAFNEETLARAVARSRIPVISAVGHEPDVTISDYAADRRAATPSNGAELAVPDRMELRAGLSASFSRMLHSEKNVIERKKSLLLKLSSRKEMSSPLQYLTDRRMTVSIYEQKLEKLMQSIIAVKKNSFVKAAATLDAISPLKVISRGYSIAEKDGKVVKSVKSVETGDKIHIRLSDGKIGCVVEEKEI